VLGKSYDRTSWPLNVTVMVNLRIEQVHSIDTKKGKVFINAAIRLWWHDARLAYPQNETYGTAGLLVDKNDVWWPSDIGLVNVHGVSTLGSITSPVVRVNYTGECYSSVVTQYTLDCPMEVSKFPYDTQMCPIQLESWLHNAELISLIPTGTAGGLLSPSAKDLEFALIDGGYAAKYHVPIFGAEYITTEYYLKLERYPEFYVYYVVIPTVILGYITFFGMFIDRKAAPARVGLGVTTCLTQAALRIPVAQYTPVSREGTWLGWFQTVGLLFCAMGVLEYCIVNYFNHRTKQKLNHRGVQVHKCLSRIPTFSISNALVSDDEGGETNVENQKDEGKVTTGVKMDVHGRHCVDEQRGEREKPSTESNPSVSVDTRQIDAVQVHVADPEASHSAVGVAAEAKRDTVNRSISNDHAGAQAEDVRKDAAGGEPLTAATLSKQFEVLFRWIFGVSWTLFVAVSLGTEGEVGL